jgi:F-type H+-transporting ATPase subunit a
MLGEHGAKYAIYLVSVLLYLGFANVIDVLGFKPPTKTLNVTASLALMSIILVQYAGIRARGLKGWLRAFKQPMALVTPFNILDLFTRPLSLCMRLFGNVLGAFIIMEILKHVVPIIIPAAFSLYFDFFDGILQAYVFVFLTGLYIKEATEIE